MRAHNTKMLAACFLFLMASPALANPPLDPDQVTKEDQDRLVAHFNLNAVKYSTWQSDVHVALLNREPAEMLVRVRRACAVGNMPIIYALVAADGVKAHKEGGTATPMPDLTFFCHSVLDLAKQTDSINLLYQNLALQEQGFRERISANQDAGITGGQPAATMFAILKAANAAQTSYTAISGQSRPLPCPLALDAGYSWATGDASAQVPLALDGNEAITAEEQCYQPGVTSITLQGHVLPASKAGLILGAWFAKQ